MADDWLIGDFTIAFPKTFIEFFHFGSQKNIVSSYSRFLLAIAVVRIAPKCD